MPRRFYEKDGDVKNLNGLTVAIIGFGSQGHAHALNLRDSGVDVVVGLRPDSASVPQARDGGLRVEGVGGGPPVEAAADAPSLGEVVMLLVPDEKHRDVWEGEVRDGVAEGNTLLF